MVRTPAPLAQWQPMTVHTAEEGHISWLSGLVASPDGTYFASADWSGKILLWKLPEVSLHWSITLSEPGPTWLSFSPDSRYLAAGRGRGWSEESDGTRAAVIQRTGLSIYDLESGERLRTFQDDQLRAKGRRVKFQAVQFSADGSQVIASCTVDQVDSQVFAWDVTTGRRIGLASLEDRQTTTLGRWRDLRRVVAAGPNSPRVEIWNLAARRRLRTWSYDGATVESVAVRDQGPWVAVGGPAPAIRIFDLESGSAIRHLVEPDGGTRAVAFSPDGAYLASASTLGTGRLWRIDP
jgi:WD40 repeat protein